MTTRQYFENSSLTEVNNTDSSVWTDVASLTFTGDANKDYVVFWSFEVQITVATDDVKFRIFDGTTAFSEGSQEAKETSSPIDYRAPAGFFRVQNGGSPSSKTFTLQVQREAASGTARGKRGRLVALRLETGDIYAESIGTQTSSGATIGNAVTATTSIGTDYIILASLVGTGPSTSTAWQARLRDDTTDFGGVFSHQQKETPNYMPLMMAATRNVGSTSIHAAFGRTSIAGSATISEARILCLDAAGFDNVYAVSSGSDDSGTNTTYTDTSTTQTFTPAATPHLTIATWVMEGTSTSISNYTQFVDNGSTITESIQEPSSISTLINSYIGGSVSFDTFAASSRTQKIQRMSETGSTTTRVIAGATIISLDLGGGGGGGGPTAKPTFRVIIFG